MGRGSSDQINKIESVGEKTLPHNENLESETQLKEELAARNEELSKENSKQADQMKALEEKIESEAQSKKELAARNEELSKENRELADRIKALEGEIKIEINSREEIIAKSNRFILEENIELTRKNKKIREEWQVLYIEKFESLKNYFETYMEAFEKHLPKKLQGEAFIKLCETVHKSVSGSS